MLMDVMGASKKLCVSPATIYKWVHLRRVPFVKLGSRVLFEEKALDKWIGELVKKPVAK